MSDAHEPLVLGVDGGGTTTICVAARPGGSVAGRGAGGPSNVLSGGHATAVASLRDAMRAALQGAPVEQIVSVCAALAGSAELEARRLAKTAVADALAGVGERAAIARIEVVPDAYAALVGGAGRAVGIVAVAGTGSIIWGRNEEGETARAGGWGYLLDDEGSGYELGRLALRAVMRAHDGRGDATALTPLVLRHFEVGEPHALVGRVYSPPLPVSEVAQVGRLVCEAGAAGDDVARRLLADGAEELARGVDAVARRLGLAEDAFALVLSGSLARHPLYRDLIAARARARLPSAIVAEPAQEPAVGAAWLALAQAGLPGPLSSGAVSADPTLGDAGGR